MLLSFSLLRRSLLLAAFGLLASSVVQANGPVRVGSKIDTEGKLLGNIMVLALEANGIKTENKVSLGNTKIVRTALVAGEIDIYPEYTGNGAFMLARAGLLEGRTVTTHWNDAEALAQLRPYIAEHLLAGGAMHHITRHVLGLGTGFPGARKFRQLLSVDIHKAKDPLALLDQAAELLAGR